MFISITVEAAIPTVTTAAARNIRRDVLSGAMLFAVLVVVFMDGSFVFASRFAHAIYLDGPVVDLSIRPWS